jgi:DNA-binding HxlR family transcriptional regulator
MQGNGAIIGLADRELEVLRFCSSRRRGATIDELRDQFPALAEATIRHRLSALKGAGMVKTSRYRVRGLAKYFVTDCGRQALAHAERMERAQ